MLLPIANGGVFRYVMPGAYCRSVVTAGAGAGWVGGQRRVAQAGWLLLAGPVLPDPGSLLRQFIRKIR